MRCHFALGVLAAIAGARPPDIPDPETPLRRPPFERGHAVRGGGQPPRDVTATLYNISDGDKRHHFCRRVNPLGYNEWSLHREANPWTGALIYDCKAMIAELERLKPNGRYDIVGYNENNWDKTVPVRAYKSCAFGLRPDSLKEMSATIDAAIEEEVEPTLPIGTRDIIDMVALAIGNFQYKGRVGGSGQLRCQEMVKEHGGVVLWTVYSNAAPLDYGRSPARHTRSASPVTTTTSPPAKTKRARA